MASSRARHPSLGQPAASARRPRDLLARVGAALLVYGRALLHDGRCGVLVGLAFSTSLLLQWLGIAVTGSPGGERRIGLALVLEVVAVSAAVYHLAGAPRSRSAWTGLPLVGLAGLVAWLLLVGTAAVLVPLMPYSIIPLLTGVLVQLVLAAVVFPLVILLAVALGSGAAHPARLWVRLFWLLPRRARLRWVAEYALLTGVWPLLQLPLQAAVVAWVPFPALTALVVAAVNAAGWAIVAGRLVSQLRRDAVPLLGAEPGGPARATDTGRAGDGAAVAGAGSRGAPARCAVYAAGAVLLGIAFLVACPAMQVRAALSDAYGATTQSAAAALNDAPGAALQGGTLAMGGGYSALAVARAQAGDGRGTGASLVSAAWWAPALDTVQRTRAWWDAVPGSGGAGDVGLAVETLRHLGDDAGYEQAQGLWEVHHGGGGRDHLFAALARDPGITAAMPDGVETWAPGTGRLADAAQRLLDVQQDGFGQEAVSLVNDRAFGGAAVLAGSTRALEVNAPGTPLKPVFSELYADADIHAHSGDAGAAVASLVAAFDVAHDDGQRNVAAASVLSLSAGRGLPEPTGPLVVWADQHGDPSTQLARAMWFAGANDRLSARKHLGPVLALESAHPSASSSDGELLSRAHALRAIMAYTDKQYPDALEQARLSEQTGNGDTRALAEAVTGNATLDAGGGGAEAAGEQQLRAAVHDNPYSFMTWFALSRLDLRRGDRAQAVQDDKQALVSYELASAGGLGQDNLVMSPTTGQAYLWTGNAQLERLLSTVDSDVAGLAAPTP